MCREERDGVNLEHRGSCWLVAPLDVGDHEKVRVLEPGAGPGPGLVISRRFVLGFVSIRDDSGSADRLGEVFLTGSVSAPPPRSSENVLKEEETMKKLTYGSVVAAILALLVAPALGQDPGDVGSPECLAVQLEAQTAVGSGVRTGTMGS